MSAPLLSSSACAISSHCSHLDPFPSRKQHIFLVPFPIFPSWSFPAPLSTPGSPGSAEFHFWDGAAQGSRCCSSPRIRKSWIFPSTEPHKEPRASGIALWSLRIHPLPRIPQNSRSRHSSPHYSCIVGFELGIYSSHLLALQQLKGAEFNISLFFPLCCSIPSLLIMDKMGATWQKNQCITKNHWFGGQGDVSSNQGEIHLIFKNW